MTRWYHWTILAGLIALGAALRFHQITRASQWPDEFWSSVHLATGRGSAVFHLPANVLIDPPPQTLLEGAPAWPHIWTGLRDVVHPPVYFIVLRWWMDLFGESDFSTRALSALFSLAGVAVLFDVVQRISGPIAGLLAAAMMAVSPSQIDFSQDARSYTLLVLLGLLACRELILIEEQRATRWRLIQFGALLIATALTHYFSFGALLAIGCYVLLRLRGPDRRRTLAAIFISGLIVLAVWGHFLAQQWHGLFVQQAWSLEPTNIRSLPWLRAAALPSALLYGRFTDSLAWLAPAFIVYVFPILCIRRQPRLMLWWFWAVGIIGSLLVYDLLNHARLLIVMRYSFLATVALYALFSTPIPVKRWWRWLLPGMFLASTVVFSIARIQVGPSEENGDWRAYAVALDQMAGPNDPLIFYPDNFWGSPMYYLAFSHYAPNSRRPIMYLEHPTDAATLRQLAPFQRVWLIGSPGNNPSHQMPGWKPMFSRGYPNSAMISSLVRASLPSEPSRPESP